MSKRQFILVLLLVPLIPHGSAIINGSSSSVNLAQDSESHNITHQIDLPVLSNKNQSSVLDPNESWLIDGGGGGTIYEIQELIGLQDRLGLSSLNTSLNQSTGELPWNYIQNPEALHFFIQNQLYTHHKTLQLGTDLQQMTYLTVELLENNFEINSTAFGYFSLDFEFSEFTLSLILNSTPSYQSFVSNQTGVLKFVLAAGSSFNMSLQELASLASSSTPTGLDAIKWTVYGSELYNFSSSFSTISLINKVTSVPISPVMGIDELTSSSRFVLGPFDTVTVTPQLSLWLDLRYIQILNSTIVLEGEISFVSEGVMFDCELNTSSLDNDYHYHFLFGSRFASVETEIVNGSLPDTSSSHNIQALLRSNDLDISVSGKIQQGASIEFNWDSPIQRHVVILLHQDSGSFVSESTSSQGIALRIPLNWSKGAIQFFVINNLGEYVVENQSLQLSPSVIITPDEIRINPTQTQTIEIELMNVTSGELFTATQVISYYNGEQRQQNDNSRLIIEPGEFSVPAVIQINASYPGMIPAFLEISLYPSLDNISPSLSASRTSSHTAEIAITLPNFNQWEVETTFVVFGSGLNKSITIDQSQFVISIENEDWNEELSYDLNFILVFEQDIGKFYGIVTIPSMAESDNNSGPLIFGIMSSSIIGAGSFAYKYIKRKDKVQTISF